MYTCYAVGNPLVDVVIETDEKTLKRYGLKKGYFHLKPKEEALEIMEELRSEESLVIPGGAAANTCCGVTGMGGTAYFCGGIGDDDLGVVFSNALAEAGVHSGLKTYSEPTGFVVVLLTPDAERTFVVHLGASVCLDESALDRTALLQSNFLYFTGYQFEPEPLRHVIRKAAQYTQKTVTRVAMDLADPGIVERNRQPLQEFICKYVDILCGNEEEGRMYTQGLSGEKCIKKMNNDAEYAVLTLGRNGSLICSRGKTAATPAHIVEPVDTTGAGDMHTAGVLFGMDRGYSLEHIGKIGSFASSLVICQKGARMFRSIAREVEEL